MKLRSLLFASAIAVSVYGNNHNYDFTNENIIAEIDPTTHAKITPFGLDSAKVPLFISFGFDDNRYADGVDWVRDTLFAGRTNPTGNGNKGTYDGTPMVCDFYVIANADFDWSETPHNSPIPTNRPVTESWIKAYNAGFGINNHTFTHNYNLSDLSLSEWKNNGELPPLNVEIGMCSQYLTNIGGMPVSDIFGIRTPYLAHSASDNASFQATVDQGILYDCTLDNWMQGNQPATWATPMWPGMMNDGWWVLTAVATKGLWQIPNAIYQTSEGATFSDKGFDSGRSGWPGGASRQDMFNQMKSAIIWAYNKNRAAVDLGLHSDYYSNEAQNKAGTAANGFSTPLTERQGALIDLLDWIEAELPDARVVNKIDIIRWMRNPVELDNLSRNTELSFSESQDVITLSDGSESYTSSGSSASISGNTATVTVADQDDNWKVDAWAGMKWKLNGSAEGTHSVRVTYKSDLPLRLMLVQDNMENKEAGYYGIGLPTTQGKTKTVELPLVTDYFEPPRPYVATTTLDLAQVSEVALVGQVYDTTMSGSFEADIEMFGGAVSVEKPSMSTSKQAIAVKSFTNSGAMFSVPAAGNYKVELFSLNGKKIVSQQFNLLAGENRVNWNSHLSSGLYVTKISGNGKSVVLRNSIAK